MPKGRPRQFDTNQALETAMRLFWRQGYEGTSLTDLTTAMGISAPSLYAAFGNKESLFKTVLQRYLQSQACYLPNALKQPTARQAVEQMFRGAIDMAMNQKQPTGCMLVQGALATSAGGQQAKQILDATRHAAESAVRKRFEQAIHDGELPKETNPAKLARFIITLIWGLSVQAAGGATRAQLKQVAEMALQIWPV